MSHNFKSYAREQDYILPPSILNWLPQDELVWFVIDAVKVMDISELYRNYRQDGSGGSAYNPQMMLTLLLYSYCVGERSSRKIERLCKMDMAYRVITVNQYPDHATIARFRRDNLLSLENIFIEVLKLCKEAKLLKLGVVALDGKKIQGNTNLSSNKRLEWFEAQAKKMLTEAEAVDADEDVLFGKQKRRVSLPRKYANHQKRLERLLRSKARLEAKAKVALEAASAKAEAAEARFKAGKKPRGKKSAAAAKAEAAQNQKANATDPESRAMKNYRGFVQGYNGQAVATEEQFIIAAELTQDCNDKKQLIPMVVAANDNVQKLGDDLKLEVVLADNGYLSESNLQAEGDLKVELIISTKQDAKQRKELATNVVETKSLESQSKTEQMREKLKGERGGKMYKKRGGIIEPVFGQMVNCQKLTKFSMRGFAACKAEWKLIAGTHNLLKMWRNGGMSLMAA